jgi:hypothetical protein
VIAAFAFLLGGTALCSSLGLWTVWWRVKRFKKVTARIFRAHWTSYRRRSGTERHHFHIEFEYTIDGEKYVSEHVSDLAMTPIVGKTYQATRGKPPYKYGDTVEAYYDPNDPKTSFLKRRSGGCAIMAFLATALLLGLGAYCAYQASSPVPEPQTIIVPGPER